MKKSVLMLKKEKSFVGQPAVFWETKREDQCFGEEEELDDDRKTLIEDFATLKRPCCFSPPERIKWEPVNTSEGVTGIQHSA